MRDPNKLLDYIRNAQPHAIEVILDVVADLAEAAEATADVGLARLRLRLLARACRVGALKLRTRTETRQDDPHHHQERNS